MNEETRTEAPNPRLTPREREIMALIAEGKHSKEVAGLLYISKRTVDFHIANVYAKLDVANRVQAINALRQMQMLP